MVSRIEASVSWPRMRAATRPCLSSTSVVGTAVGGHVARERELHAAVVDVDDRRVGDAEVVLEGCRGRGLVAHIHADEGDALVVELLVTPAAAAAPRRGTARSPAYQKFTTMTSPARSAESNVAAVDGLAVERDRLAALVGGELRHGAVAGDEALAAALAVLLGERVVRAAGEQR